MFISRKYEEKGFVPSHPLSFMTEVYIQNAASLLLKIFVNKRSCVEFTKDSSKIIDSFWETDKGVHVGFEQQKGAEK